MRDIISQVQKLLQTNPEWIERYATYAEAIQDNLSAIKAHKKLFHEWAPLYLYMNITESKGSLTFSLRYLGQDVAKIKVRKDKVLTTTKSFDSRNLRDFRCDVKLDDVEWNSNEAARFRQHFATNPQRAKDSLKGNEEHRVESLLLNEFSKSIGATKLIRNIQPVKIAGLARFQMPTPLSGSDINKLKYSGASGGGIDILSRIGVGKATSLCVMEVKDENTSKEPPEKAIQQGLAYAVFIRELLRSKSGEKWWKIFGYSGQIPDKLNLYVACVMPTDNSRNEMFGNSITVDTDSFHLRSLYFKEDGNKLESIDTSLELCEVST